MISGKLLSIVTISCNDIIEFALRRCELAPPLVCEAEAEYGRDVGEARAASTAEEDDIDTGYPQR